MKKLLSVVLALLMVVSSMACLFTGQVSAETTAPEDINWQSPASWVTFETLDSTPAAKGPLVQMKSAANQALYARVNLEANTYYNYTMYVKNLTLSGSYNQFSIVSSLGSDELDFAKLSSGWRDYKPADHLADGATVAYNSYFKDLGATEVTGADGATWNKISINFTTGAATQYIIAMNSFALVDANDTSVYISDAAFTEAIEWKSPASWVSFQTLSSTPAVNGPLVQMKSAASQALYARVNLKANTEYNYTMYVKNLTISGSYNQFSIVSSLGSDDLDFAKLSAGWRDYKPTDHLADGAEQIYNSYFKDLGATEVTGADGATWNKISINFTTGAATQYIITMNSFSLVDGNDNNVYISDAVFNEIVNMTATAEGNGTARVSKESLYAGEEVTFTAAPFNGSFFLGWYNGQDEMVSDQKVYTVTANSSLDLTAKFQGGIPMLNWQSPASWVSFVTLDSTPAVNGPLVQMKSAANQAIYARVDLEANTEYNYTMYVKNLTISGSYNQFSIVSSLGSDELDFAKLDAGWRDYKPASHLADGAEQIYNSYFKDLGATEVTGADGATWTRININFTTGAATQYIIAMNSFALVDGNDNNVYISDVSMVKKCNMTATAEGNGTAKVSAETVDSGENVTFTAMTSGGSTFLGWYNGETLVSSDLVYTVAPTDSLNLTAKFQGGIPMLNWQSPASWVTFETLNSTPAVNGPLVKMKSAASQALYTRVNLEANTKYNYTMYVKNLTISGSYCQFSIVSSLGSDELDFAKLSSGWRDYKPADHLADGAVQIYNSYFKDLGATEVTGADGETWTKISIDFTTSTATQYIITMNSFSLVDSNDNNVYISDAVFNKIVNVTAGVEGAGAAIVSKDSVYAGEEVTFTAITSGGSTFLGWYDAKGNLVSDEQVYTVTVTENLALVARFKGGSMAVDGWYSPRGGANWITTTDAIEAKVGGTVYTTGSWPCDRSIYAKVTLKPDTTYTFSAYFMGAVAAAVRNDSAAQYENGKGDEAWVISAKADITKGSAGSSTGISDWNEFTGKGTYENLYNGDGSLDAWADTDKYTTWRKYTITFTTQEDTEYYIILGLEGDSSYQTGQASGYPTYMSDATIAETPKGIAPEGEEILTHPGTAIRKASADVEQALRFKFTIDHSVIDEALEDGYKLVEYGSVVATTSKLKESAADPVLNRSSSCGYKAIKAMAYQKAYSASIASTDIAFAKDNEGNVTYTAALYNISEANYGKQYSVRPYAIFSNGSETYVRYGTTRSASVFDVAYAILNNEEPVQSDVDYVNNTLLTNVQDAYEAWVEENK